jgi:recombination protein RecA
MAKEKTKEVETLASIKSDYGEDVIVTGDRVLEEEKIIIPISPKLDLITNGGMPEGCWVTLVGKPKSGKTSLALHIAANCQKPEYGEREVYYFDIEGRFKTMNLRGVNHINKEKFYLIRSTKNKIFSAQEFLNMAEKILKTKPHCVVIIDSYSMLSHSKEQAEGTGTSTRGAGGYTLLAQFCRTMSNVVPVMSSNVIGITHLMANVSGYGSPWQEKGGNAIGYQVDLKLRVKGVEPWRVGGQETGRQIGQIVKWACEVSALGGPGQEIDGYLRYGKGIDELYELIDMAIDMGLVSKAASWYTLDFLESKEKVQGQEGVYQYLLEHSNSRDILLQSIKDEMGVQA